MDRAAKAELVTALHDVFKDAGVVVVSHYAGMTVAQMTDYRRKIKAAGGSVRVAKNRQQPARHRQRHRRTRHALSARRAQALFTRKIIE